MTIQTTPKGTADYSIPHPFRYRRITSSMPGAAAIAAGFQGLPSQRSLQSAYKYLHFLAHRFGQPDATVYDVSAIGAPTLRNKDLAKVCLANLSLDEPVYLHFGRQHSLLFSQSADIHLEGAYVRKNSLGDFELDIVVEDTEFQQRALEDTSAHFMVLSAVFPALIDGREQLRHALDEIRDTARDDVASSDAYANACVAAVHALLYLARQRSGQAEIALLPTSLQNRGRDETVIKVGRVPGGLTKSWLPDQPQDKLDRSRSMALPPIPRQRGGFDIEGPLDAAGAAEIAHALVSHGVIPQHEIIQALNYALSRNFSVR